MSHELTTVQKLVAKIDGGYEPLTPKEKFCLLFADSNNLENCLNEPIPASTIDPRRIRYIAAAIHGEDGGDILNPWEKFCLVTSTTVPLAEAGDCLNGLP